MRGGSTVDAVAGHIGISEFVKQERDIVEVRFDKEVWRGDSAMPWKSKSAVRVGARDETKLEPSGARVVDLDHFRVLGQHEIDQGVSIGEALRASHPTSELVGSVAELPHQTRYPIRQING